MKRTVWSYGCSVSACSNWKCDSKEEVYSKFLADKLNAKHKNYAIGCGSNSRIFRLLFKHLSEEKITPDDVVTVQYTTAERREFFSKHVYPGDILREDYEDGQVFNFKVQHYGRHKDEIKAFKLYENNCLSREYELELLRGNHAALLALANYKNINLIFIDAYQPAMFPSNKIENNIGEESLNIEDVTDMFKIDKYLQIDEKGNIDRGHFSVAGHKEIADRLFNLINSKRIVVDK